MVQAFSQGKLKPFSNFESFEDKEIPQIIQLSQITYQETKNI